MMEVSSTALTESEGNTAREVLTLVSIIAEAKTLRSSERSNFIAAL